MNFVKSFEIDGIKAAQVPCLLGRGAPTGTTEGALGCLYMDTDTGDLYKCIAVVGGAYSWGNVGAGGGSMDGNDIVDVHMLETQYVKLSSDSSAPGHVVLRCQGETGTIGEDAPRVVLESSNRGSACIGGVASPLYDDDAANKEYVDDKIAEIAGGGSGSAVLYTEQKLTEEQKVQARSNIQAAYADGEGNLYLQDETSNESITFSVAGNDYDENGSVKNGNLTLSGDYNCHVRVCWIADGVDDHDAVTVGQLNAIVGDISTALDTIIAMQEELIGV